MRPAILFFFFVARQDSQKNSICSLIADIDSAPEELQLELIDMQSDHTVKEMFNAVTLAEKFPFMKKFAGKMFSVFGSTYICEQSFSCLKINKSKYRCSLTDINLQAVMRISASNLTPDLKKKL
jgi:hypothetical protein